jgi:HrpA-like RNA helicase
VLASRRAVALLEAQPDWLHGKKLLLLQPHRVTVYAVAHRIAWLLGERVGDRVGAVPC